MEIHSDYRDLFTLLNNHKIEYLIIGAYALAYYGAPRFTGDIDIFIHNTRNNAKKLKTALDEFGFEQLGISFKDFLNEGNVIQLGQPPLRIDFLTSIEGVTWEEAWTQKEENIYGDVQVYIIGKNEFIKNKKTLGRKKDLADLEALGESDE